MNATIHWEEAMGTSKDSSLFQVTEQCGKFPSTLTRSIWKAEQTEESLF